MKHAHGMPRTTGCGQQSRGAEFERFQRTWPDAKAGEPEIEVSHGWREGQSPESWLHASLEQTPRCDCGELRKSTSSLPGRLYGASVHQSTIYQSTSQSTIYLNLPVDGRLFSPQCARPASFEFASLVHQDELPVIQSIEWPCSTSP